jgi:predicted phage terminase large subunit-like protein
LNIKNLEIASPLQIESEICKKSLYQFVVRAWPVLFPTTSFVPGWHINAVCHYLEATVIGVNIGSEKKYIRNLILNIPFRHMKSLLADVFFPAWIWTFQPEKKFLFIGYSETAAIEPSTECRKLIESAWYRERFNIELAKDDNTKTSFTNTIGGYRKSFGMDGSIMGKGGEIVVVDDPLKASDIYSETIRNDVNKKYDEAVSTRLNDMETGVRIVIMQRLHVDDLTGHLLSKKDVVYENLVLPAEYEGIRFVSSIGFVDPRTKVGELLWPEKFGVQVMKELKDSLGSELAIAGQLQQRPSTIAGNIYKKDWFKSRVDNIDIVARYISWDTASTINETSAYSACCVFELTSNYKLFLREVYRAKLEYPELQEAIEKFAEKYKYKLKGIIIESKSSGISVMQSIAKTSPDWMSQIMFPFNPVSNGGGDKTTRGYLASVWAENNCILLPPPSENYPWLFDFEDELFSAPNSKNLDQFDSFNQGVIFLENYLAEGLRSRRESPNFTHEILMGEY